ncbi:MAG TPA: bacillithiol biosynthesis cysteine-adding enzyme BshC [Terriglobales bacterium]|jgi:bacillithiol biosynthesis cysteine-adding enzyme BshC|nr:bacillithiol biosynthesis cysteine-adding enzyme BshC [Terriglobales bacterium]
MKSQCLPFTQIPHTTRLFLDYLSYAPAVRDFYPRSPIFSEWLQEESRRVTYDAVRRARVSDILARQNHAWGASPKTLANIDRLRNGALAAVTGQQVGLFGGPLFSIFKALTAVKLADEATAAGVDCVPVFWLATEDHDLAEVSHVALLAEHGLPESFAVDANAFETNLVSDAPVGTITFGPGIAPIVDRAAALLGDSDISTWFREAYQPGENLGSAFALLFARLFADWGVILLDPADKDFHDLVKPLFRAAIERSSELDDALLARGKAIEAAGYHQQVKVTSATTPLFEVRNGARTVIRRRNAGADGEGFAVGEEHISRAELLDRIEKSPENFNPSVLLRPVVQDYLLPTLVYTGGAAEVAYFAQVAVVYEKLLGRVTPVLPRFSATLVEPKPERILTRYQLSLPDVLQGQEKVRAAIAARSLPLELQARFEEAYASVERSMTALRESIGKLDSTLLDTAESSRSSMAHQIDRLRARVARAEEQRNDVITRHAEVLTNALFPHKSLQEREVAGVSFVARYGVDLLANLYQLIRPDCHDHQVIEVQ